MPDDLRRRAAAVLGNDALRTTLTRSTGILRGLQAPGFVDTAELPALQASARALRHDALARLPELLDQLERQASANGVAVFWAPDAAAAADYVLALAQNQRTARVTRSRSAVLNEIHLDTALRAAGIEPAMTHVGEAIIRLAGDTPSHAVYPALHWRKEDVARLLSEQFNVPTSLNIDAQTGTLTFRQRRPLLETVISVSGVAFAVAETGALAFVDDDGGDRLALAVSQIHVAVMGLEQVVTSPEELTLLLSLAARSTHGRPFASHTTLLYGPSPEASADGPRQVHLVILDNGRSDLLRWGYGEVLTCLQCGACQNVCPVYREIGGQAYTGDGQPGGPIDALRIPLRAAASNSRPIHAGPIWRSAHTAEPAQASTLCGACRVVCPVGIDIPQLLLRLRGEMGAAGGQPVDERLLRRLYAWSMADPARYRRLHGFLLRQGLPAPAPRPFRERWRTRHTP